jgi:hypothetical protein
LPRAFDRFGFVFIDLRCPKTGGKIADTSGMSLGALSGIASSVESIVATALQSVGLNVGRASSASTTPSDNSGVSPLGQILSTLQQLQQTNPSQYKTVTQQIAGNLRSAAQTATANGNTTAANELTQLSSDFTNASTSGQLPNIQDLAQAAGAGGRHRHHHYSQIADSQTAAASNDSLNPLNIIGNTLSNAGLTSAG